MNKEQLLIICDQKGFSGQTKKALELVLIDGLTVYAAEKQALGAVTATIGRRVITVTSELEYIEKFSAAK